MNYNNAYYPSDNHNIDWYPDTKGKYGPAPPVIKVPRNVFKIASAFISNSYGGKAGTISSSCNNSRSGNDFSNPNKVFG